MLGIFNVYRGRRMNRVRRRNRRVSRVEPSRETIGTSDWARVECRVSSQKTEDLLDLLNVTDIDTTDTCSICLDLLWPKEFSENPLEQPEGSDHLPVRPKQCEDHHFHLGCIKEWVCTNPVCPLCRKTLIVITGYQPNTDGSKMTTQILPTHLPGHDNCGTISIQFVIKGGIQTMSDPLPGDHFPDYNFNTYLPDNGEGRELLRLLELAWNRGLLFRIGYSLETKKTNRIIPNGIEMKIRTDGGIQNRGYPDVSYMSRLKSDLLEIGVK